MALGCSAPAGELERVRVSIIEMNSENLGIVSDVIMVNSEKR